MMELFVGTYGETDPASGSLVRLSATGLRQALCMAGRFNNVISDPRRAAVLTSPTTRTLEAGAIVAKVTNINEVAQHSAIWQIAMGAEVPTASGLRMVTTAVLTRLAYDTPDLDHVLVISEPRLVKSVHDGTFDPEEIYPIPPMDEAMAARDLPAMEILGNVL